MSTLSRGSTCIMYELSVVNYLSVHLCEYRFVVSHKESVTDGSYIQSVWWYVLKQIKFRACWDAQVLGNSWIVAQVQAISFSNRTVGQNCRLVLSPIVPLLGKFETTLACWSLLETSLLCLSRFHKYTYLFYIFTKSLQLLVTKQLLWCFLSCIQSPGNCIYAHPYNL